MHLTFPEVLNAKQPLRGCNSKVEGYNASFVAGNFFLDFTTLLAGSLSEYINTFMFIA